jgi:Domain of unknown function (DUF1707)
MVVERRRGGPPSARAATKEAIMDNRMQVNAGQPAPGRELRASDAERDRTVKLLNQHVVEGRLTQEEFTERVEAALAARTRGELDALLVDLPASPPPPAPVTDDRPRAWRPAGPPLVAMGLLALLVIGSIAGWVVGDRTPGPPFPFFPLFPLLFWGFLLAMWAGWGRSFRGRR